MEDSLYESVLSVILSPEITARVFAVDRHRLRLLVLDISDFLFNVAELVPPETVDVMEEHPSTELRFFLRWHMQPSPAMIDSFQLELCGFVRGWLHGVSRSAELMLSYDVVYAGTAVTLLSHLNYTLLEQITSVLG